MTKWRTICYGLLLSLVASLSAGCGVISSSGVSIYVESDAAANKERPFYMVVRAVDEATYMKETYQEVAAKVFGDPEKTVLKTEVIYPGKSQEMTLDMEEDVPLAIYFLFTEPGGSWKTYLSQPVPDSIYFEIAGNGIKTQE